MQQQIEWLAIFHRFPDVSIGSQTSRLIENHKFYAWEVFQEFIFNAADNPGNLCCRVAGLNALHDGGDMTDIPNGGETNQAN